MVNDSSEIPKYYAQNSHPAIVSAEVFDLTKMELEWRRSLKGSYSGKSCFASRIVCGDCGAFYGSKVWHGTDEYRRTIWRCNNKYGGDAKCSTPHITQEELEKAFVSVMQKVIAEKDATFAVCREVLDEVLDMSELDRSAMLLQDQTMLISERVRKLVEENARVRRNQEEYQGNTMRWQRDTKNSVGRYKLLRSRKRTRQIAGGRSRCSFACLRSRRNASALIHMHLWRWLIRWLLGRTESWNSSSETG